MKAATGELNLTLITIVALGAVLALFTAILWPTIKARLVNTTNNFTEDIDVSMNYSDVEFTKYVETELF